MKPRNSASHLRDSTLDRLGRIDEEMVDVLNKLNRAMQILRRELGREPTSQDLLERANTPSSDNRSARKIDPANDGASGDRR